MGSDITAFIEIDDGEDSHSREQPPFTYPPSVWDLTNDEGLTCGKHYEFYAAICGIRNKSGITPLFPCRGLPPNASKSIHGIEGDDPGVSWLTLSEIHRALKHMQVDIESLDNSVKLLLATMQIAADMYGDDRVRLVFYVD